MVVARVKLVRAGLVGMDIAAIIAPPDRFSHDCIFNVRGPSVKALRCRSGSQKTALKEVPAHAIGELPTPSY